ncbi:MAG: hypothetical protein Q4F11_02170, partial [Eubacteriales bacterium]|nr:hypothetical protein [Eubacteriales bacterium]
MIRLLLEVYELVINVLQSCMVSNFLIKCLGTKSDGRDSWIEYSTGAFITFAYLEVLNKITTFESIGIFLYLILSLFFSFCMLKGSAVEKVLTNIIMIFILAFSSLLSGGMIGIVVGKGFLEVVEIPSIRVVAIALNMLVLEMLFLFIIKLKRFVSKSDLKYMAILSGIPVFSIITCCIAIEIPRAHGQSQLIGILGIVCLIMLINVLCLILFALEHKQFSENIN